MPSLSFSSDVEDGKLTAKSCAFKDENEIETWGGSWAGGMTTLIQPPEVMTRTGKSASEVSTLSGSIIVAPTLAETDPACPDARESMPANKIALGVKLVRIRRLNAIDSDQL